MENQNSKREKLTDEKFRFHFSGTMLAVLIVLLLLCAAGIGLTTWQFAGFVQSGDISSVYEWLKYLLLYFASILLGILVAAMLVKSQYVVSEKLLTMQFGLIRSKYEIKKIASVKLFRGSNKLTVYFDDFKTKYIVIVVKDVWYDEFVKSLIARNERIDYDFISPEEEQEWKKKK